MKYYKVSSKNNERRSQIFSMLGKLAIILSLAYPQLHNTPSHLLGLFRAFLGIIIGGGIIYLTGVIGDFIFKKEPSLYSNPGIIIFNSSYKIFALMSSTFLRHESET